jgi:23S rRNA (adenine2503-C2)-methyltransferase
VSGRPCIKGFGLEPLRERLAGLGAPRWRADQVAAWLYVRGVDDFEAMTDLGQDLRARLAAAFAARALELASARTSTDGTVKAVLRARDGALVESVLIPEPGRTTLCISTQVGCPLACAFCATGAMGFARNLRAAEIVDQVCQMRRLLPPGRRITNVVFMGMGEPLLNLPAVVDAARLLLHPKAFAMAPRRVTVSTVGVRGRIERLLREVSVNLAVSLHATTDELRDRLVPHNRSYPLGALLDALRGLEGLRRRRPVFFEYTLIAGVNDGVEDARRLAPLLRGIPSKLNVIPMNRHADSPLGPPDEATIDRFVGEVAASGLAVTLRRSRGPDIDAACGQLALRQAAAGDARSGPELPSSSAQPSGVRAPAGPAPPAPATACG